MNNAHLFKFLPRVHLIFGLSLPLLSSGGNRTYRILLPRRAYRNKCHTLGEAATRHRSYRDYARLCCGPKVNGHICKALSLLGQTCAGY